MRVEQVRVDDLREPERNVRTHPDYQVDEMVKAVERWGQTRAVVIDENSRVLIGNGLVAALRKMGREYAQAYRMLGLSEDDKRKLMLSDNRIFSLGLDDATAILEVIRSLDNFDIPGFDAEMLSQLALNTDDITDGALAEYGKLSEAAIAEAREQKETVCPKCGFKFVRGKETKDDHGLSDGHGSSSEKVLDRAARQAQ